MPYGKDTALPGLMASDLHEGLRLVFQEAERFGKEGKA